MRRVIIQIYSVYFSIYFLFAGFLTIDSMVGVFFVISGLINLIVAVKLSFLKSRTNMIYIAIFLHLNFVITYFLNHKFIALNHDRMKEYIYRTMPDFLQSAFLVLNLAIVFLALIEFANARVVE